MSDETWFQDDAVVIRSEPRIDPEAVRAALPAVLRSIEREAAYDALDLAFIEVRNTIDAARAMCPSKSDRELSLALLLRGDGPARESALCGLAAYVLDFTTNHVR